LVLHPSCRYNITIKMCPNLLGANKAFVSFLIYLELYNLTLLAEVVSNATLY